MPFYLTEWIGGGTRQNPYKCVGSDEVGAGIIDLRPDASQLDGGGLNAALLKTNAPFSDARARFLADDKLEAPTNQVKNFLENKLGMDLSSPTLLRDIIATIMTNPPVNGWKTLLPTRLQYEIWMGGELVWNVPRISGGATDNFNRANENPIAAPWVGDPDSGFAVAQIISNAGGATADAIAFYTNAATSNDQYAQCSAGSTQGGPAVRADNIPANAYSVDANGGTEITFKWVNGAFTSLENWAGTRTNPLRIEVEGSSIRYYSNGVQDANSPVTDTSLTTGQPGFFTYASGASGIDNWEGGDLAPPEEKQTFYMRRTKILGRSWR